MWPSLEWAGWPKQAVPGSVSSDGPRQLHLLHPCHPFYHCSTRQIETWYPTASVQVKCDRRVRNTGEFTTPGTDNEEWAWPPPLGFWLARRQTSECVKLPVCWLGVCVSELLCSCLKFSADVQEECCSVLSPKAWVMCKHLSSGQGQALLLAVNRREAGVTVPLIDCWEFLCYKTVTFCRPHVTHYMRPVLRHIPCYCVQV